MTAREYWHLHSTTRCLNKTAGYLFVAEWKRWIAEEEEDWSQLAKALEESELEAVLDGRSSWEDTESCCSFVRTLDLPLIARLFPRTLGMLWAALAEMEQMEAVDGKVV